MIRNFLLNRLIDVAIVLWMNGRAVVHGLQSVDQFAEVEAQVAPLKRELRGVWTAVREIVILNLFFIFIDWLVGHGLRASNPALIPPWQFCLETTFVKVIRENLLIDQLGQVAKWHHFERSLVPTSIITILAIITLIAVLFFFSLAYIRWGQVENLASELGPLLEPLLLLALGETFFGLVSLACLTKLIIIHDFRESILSFVLGLRYIRITRKCVAKKVSFMRKINLKFLISFRFLTACKQHVSWPNKPQRHKIPIY